MNNPVTNKPIMGAIFDVDDTLLNNLTFTKEGNLHNRARLLAVHQVGKDRNVPALTRVTS